MATSTDIDNQPIRRFVNAILRLEETTPNPQRKNRNYDRRPSPRSDGRSSGSIIDGTLEYLGMEDAIYDIRDYLQRSQPRGLGFNPDPPAAATDQEGNQV